jgi:glycosyltransferase involved in cell wall biosynthesis
LIAQKKINNQKPKIALLSPLSPLLGGMVQLAETLYENYRKEGYKVNRLQLGSGLQGLLPLPYLYFNFIITILRNDIIHIISASGNALWLKDLPAILFARLFNKKVILNFVGGMAIEKFKEWPWYKRLPFKLANCVVVPTNVLKENICSKLDNSRIKVIPNAVDVDIFLNNNDCEKVAQPILIAAKGLEEYAGFELLLDIFKLVKRQIPNVQFWIAGTGSMEDNLRLKIKNEKIKDATLLGNVDHLKMPNLMEKSTIFIHGSKYESFGIVLVEAMASGLPVVSFRIGGIPDVVVDNVTGDLINYGEIDTFAKRIIELIENKDKYKSYSENAISQSKLFKWDRIKHQWENLFEEL